jgi:hypothetical protein
MQSSSKSSTPESELIRRIRKTYSSCSAKCCRRISLSIRKELVLASTLLRTWLQSSVDWFRCPRRKVSSRNSQSPYHRRDTSYSQRNTWSGSRTKESKYGTKTSYSTRMKRMKDRTRRCCWTRCLASSSKSTSSRKTSSSHSYCFSRKRLQSNWSKPIIQLTRLKMEMISSNFRINKARMIMKTPQIPARSKSTLSMKKSSRRGSSLPTCSSRSISLRVKCA